MIYRLFKVYHTLKEITTIYDKSFCFGADNRTLPFPVNGSPSARFRKRNVTDVGKPTRTRPEARTKTKGEAEPLLLFWCGQQDPVPLAFTFPLAFLDI